jgi:tRNA splicing ligase
VTNTDLSPRVDRCKPCGRATVHHYIISLSRDGRRRWVSDECDAQRLTLTKNARHLTADEDAADVAKHLDRAQAIIAAHEVTP